MSLRAVGILAIVLACAWSEASPTSLVKVYAEDPLQIADLIVRGVVETSSLSSRGAPGFSYSRVRVTHLLRGSDTRRTIQIAVREDRLVPGGEYVICASWDNRARRWSAASWTGIYRREGKDRWVRHRTREYEMPDTLSTAQMTARIESGSLRSVTRQADVIATGRMTAIDVDSVYATSPGKSGRVMRYQLEVSEVLKGRAGEQIEFVIPGPDVLLARQMPPMEVGQQWLVFLAERDFGLYPFAGLNSLLQIRGRSLIYNRGAPCPLTLPEALHVIRRENRYR